MNNNSQYTTIFPIASVVQDHNPISITGNSQLTPENGIRSGSGIEGDPYIISNWEFNGTGAYRIFITSTDAFIEIRNCVFWNFTSGIKLDYCDNVKIIGCTFKDTLIEEGEDGDTPGDYGENSDAITAIFPNHSNNIEISNNLIYNLTTGDAGNGVAGTSGNNGGMGGSSGTIYGIRPYYSTFVNISNNIIFDLGTGNAGNGGQGGSGSIGLWNGGNGGHGGNAGIINGVLCDKSDYVLVKNNSIYDLITGDGGNSGNGGDAYATGGTGGNAGVGGSGGHLYGIKNNHSNHIEIINNTIVDLTAGDGGNGDYGGDGYGATNSSGNGGNGGASGMLFGIQSFISINVTIQDNYIKNLRGGYGGDGYDAGENSSGAIQGINGNGGNQWPVGGIDIYSCQFHKVVRNHVERFAHGLPGIAFDEGKAGEGYLSPSIRVISSQSSEIYANDFMSLYIIVNNTFVNTWNNGSIGNYWGDYVQLPTDLNPKDGFSDVIVNLGGDSNENDTKAAIHQIWGDTDNDGLSNLNELLIGTNYHDVDTDNDLIPDGWEVQMLLDPTNNLDGNLDYDREGLLNYEEYIANTDPFKADTDGDQFSDYEEVIRGSNPNNKFSKPTIDILYFIEENAGILVIGVIIAFSIILHGFIVRGKRGKIEKTPLDRHNDETTEAHR